MKTLEKQLSTAIKSNDISNIHFVFDLIYSEYVKLVAFTIGKYVNDIDVIKDLTQDVFVCFFENIENVKSSIKYYLISSTVLIASMASSSVLPCATNSLRAVLIA